MPFTPYHFGPSGFLGLVFKRWLDLPVFVLVNVAVDMEVLVVNMLDVGWPKHRYCHTLLLGAVVGVVWGLAAYPLRKLFKRIMQLLAIPYQSSLKKMVISGVLGVWLHVLIDGLYHWDVKILWPNKRAWLYRLLDKGEVKAVCIGCLVAAIVVYLIIVVSSLRSIRRKKTEIDIGKNS